MFAYPSELLLHSRSYGVPWSDPNRLGIDRVRWEDVKQQYGGLLVSDEDTAVRVSVLCTSEPLADWWLALMDFPFEEERPDKPHLKELRPDNPYLKRYLNSRLTDIWSFSPEGEEGLRWGWRSSLLQAIHLMLWLDLIGGRFVRECGLHDCSNYFREGSQGDKTLYCSLKHTNLASTRSSLGQTP